VFGGSTAGEQLPRAPAPLPEHLPTETGVKDPVFSILVGMVRTDTQGVLTRDHLERELERRKARTKLPYRSLRELTRIAPAPGQAPHVEARFVGPLELNIPYHILWYHPGDVRTTEQCRFREWSLGDLRIAVPGKPDGVLFEDVRLFGLADGRVEVDIDGWLDRVMGSNLDDTNVTGFALFRRAGRAYGLAIGYNRERQGRTGLFDFSEDRIVFPAPTEARALAPHLRRRLEAVLAAEPEAARSPSAR
jgi:hypothetical protein